MKVKLFTSGSGWGKPAAQFDKLETEINSWLEAHPKVAIAHAHQLSQPTFGWGQLAVAVWYSETHPA
jgi:hypothetical protein